MFMENKSGNTNSGSICAAIEAILFASGSAVPAVQLADVLCLSAKELEDNMQLLMASYEQEERGLRIVKLENAYQLCTKKEFYEVLIRMAKVPKRVKLTDVMMETLSIIAYKQPVTKNELEKIRGVQSDHAVNKLVEYGLVEEVGRLESPGRPILFGTTEEFLRHFGIASIEELPMLDHAAREDLRLEAEQEVKIEAV